MGAVYRAHHILMDKPVAVKVLRQELSSDTEAVARFHREARSASRLDHEFVIRVSDFGQTDDGLLFLVMELLDGENLAQVLRRGSLPWRRAATIARDVALGLAHAHEQGIVHRDLKPENIVIVRRGKPARQTVKVLDFGLAKIIHEAGASADGNTGSDAEPDDPAQRSLTRTGVVFGTPEYMSPEQAEGRSLGPHTDIYALGVVCYQMLTGQLPFSAPTFLALIAKTVHEAPTPPSVICPGLDLPAELEALLLQCLAKDPHDRPESADELAESLDQLLAAYPVDPGKDAAKATGTHAATAPASGPRATAEQAPVVVTSSPSAPTAHSLHPSAAKSAVEPRPSSGSPPGGVIKTVARNLPKGQLPYGANPTPALANAYATVVGDPGYTPVPESPSDSPPDPAEPRSERQDDAAAPDPQLLPAAPVSSRPPLDPAPIVAIKSEPAPPEVVNRTRSAAVDDDLVVPRRPYWIVGVLLVGALGAASYLTVPRLLRKNPSQLTSTDSDELRRARELLSPTATLTKESTAEALKLLQQERQRRNSPELQRLLSVAYEADKNRLRALGHMRTAVRMASDGPEVLRFQLALAQLLSRMGHPSEACQSAQLVLQQDPKRLDSELRKHSEALIQTLDCSSTAIRK